MLVDTSGWERVTKIMNYPVNYGEERAELSGLWIARADGAGLFQAAELYEPGRISNNETSPIWGGRHARPAWSPDDRKIAVAHPATPKKLHIFLVRW